MIVGEEQGRADAPPVGQPVTVRRRAEHRAAGNLQVLLALEQHQRRLDHLERHAQTIGQRGADELAGQMQRLGDDLQDQVGRQPGVGQLLRTRRQQGGGDRVGSRH